VRIRENQPGKLRPTVIVADEDDAGHSLGFVAIGVPNARKE
jgi:hypothetical protein